MSEFLCAPSGAPVEKVTTFVMGQRAGVAHLLLLYHPYAGIQLPAGTVEEGESAVDAALREAQEESGLEGLEWGEMLGVEREELPPARGVISLSTPVYTTPDLSSAARAELRRGLGVELVRAEGDFLQVRFFEHNRYPEPEYLTFDLLGWVPAQTVANTRIRYFARLVAPAGTPSSWTHFNDYHNFRLCWHGLNDLPELVDSQAHWLAYLPAR